MALKMAHEEFYTVILRLLIRYNTVISLFFFLCCHCQYGTTPLIWAARKGHYDCVMHLLENGANVDQEGAVCTLCFEVHISPMLM